MTAGSKRQEQLEQVTFFVEGIPVPQGSKNVSRWGNVYDANHKQLRAWSAEIAQAAHDATDHVFAWDLCQCVWSSSCRALSL